MGKQIMGHHKHWHAVTVASPTIGICNQKEQELEQLQHALPASEWQAKIATTGSPW